MKQAFKNQRGDTLLEVVFALVVLSIVLVGALGIARLSRVNTQNSQSRAQAINLVQEQYEALKSFRDSNPYGWGGFTGVSSVCPALTCAAYTLGFSRAVNYTAPYGSGALCQLATPDQNCKFHMERDRLLTSGAAYGQWIPCPGPWHPPLDSDPNWATFTVGAYSSALNAAGYGCQGDSRTLASQPNIEVSIQLASPLACTPSPSANYYSFNIVGTWNEGGSSATSSTSLSTTIANLKGDPTC